MAVPSSPTRLRWRHEPTFLRFGCALGSEVKPDNGSLFIVYGSATVAAIRRDADGWRLYERSWPRFAPCNPTQLLDAEDEHDALTDALQLTAARLAEVEWLEEAAA